MVRISWQVKLIEARELLSVAITTKQKAYAANLESIALYAISVSK
jgi:hypothetical protein